MTHASNGNINYNISYPVPDPSGCDWPSEPLHGIHCPPQHDMVNCWPATPANTTLTRPCPTFFQGVYYPAGVHGFRHCQPNGTWEHGNWTNYTVCMDYIDQLQQFTTPAPPLVSPDHVELFKTLTNIIFIASIISLVFLLISLVIFTVFRSLQCARISIHKNLVLSFIFRFIIHIITFEPYISQREHSYRDVLWLCRMLKALDNYMVAANFAWMFVEGLFLHNRLAISVFSSEAPFVLFYLIGWGIPGVLTVTWSTLMHFHNHESCWSFYTQSPLIFIVYAPIMVALVINLGFLINIIRILITKLRANNSLETARMRKTIKATVVLLPLLGMTNLLFFMKPHDDGPGMVAYHVINAILPPCQGIFVSLLYCFMNGEVQSAVKKKWQRFRLHRSMSTRGRRRSSRTSSVFISHSERLFCTGLCLWLLPVPLASTHSSTKTKAGHLGTTTTTITTTTTTAATATTTTTAFASTTTTNTAITKTTAAANRAMYIARQRDGDRPLKSKNHRHLEEDAGSPPGGGDVHLHDLPARPQLDVCLEDPTTSRT